ncbi:MAG TPA: amino acid ABC transporter substrate-binding protein [Hyphomicrobiaceae bacterium]|nr:amino acid ABC transporter substrate-binding protein [Hyphomicrobiaceae bacterium]
MLPTSLAKLTVTAGALVLGLGSAMAQDKMRIGYAISKTGPFTGGASVTTLPNYQLWVKDVNDAGGISIGGKKVPIEIVEYDDRSNSEEAVKAIERLATQDKVDIILPPWSTGLNLAVGPTFNRLGYPHLAVTAATDRAPEMAKRWPNSFWFLGASKPGAEALVEVLSKLKAENKIAGKVAMVSVADAFGIELASAARPAMKAAGFELVLDKSYPLGTQDMQAIVKDAMASGADSFVAFSYPPDTIAITDAAKVLAYNPKVFYTAVGTAFPLFKAKFGASAEGVMGVGGWNVDSPLLKAYFKRHSEVIGREPDRWASPVTYVSLQMLQQAIERVGKIDHAAIVKELQSGTFDTIMGKIKLDGNVMPIVWWVGQWQDGEFVGLAPTKYEGAKAPKAKPDWK